MACGEKMDHEPLGLFWLGADRPETDSFDDMLLHVAAGLCGGGEIPRTYQIRGRGLHFSAKTHNGQRRNSNLCWPKIMPLAAVSSAVDRTVPGARQESGWPRTEVRPSLVWTGRPRHAARDVPGRSAGQETGWEEAVGRRLTGILVFWFGRGNPALRCTTEVGGRDWPRDGPGRGGSIRFCGVWTARFIRVRAVRGRRWRGPWSNVLPTGRNFYSWTPKGGCPLQRLDVGNRVVAMAGFR